MSHEKRCPTCNTVKSETEFSKSRRRYDGLDWQCKACKSARYSANKEVVRERRAQYYRTNAERIRAHVQEYRIANLEKIRIRKQTYHQRCVEKIREKKHKYYLLNKEKFNEKSRTNYNLNIERVKAIQKIWRTVNKQKIRTFYLENREAFKKRRRKYYIEHQKEAIEYQKLYFKKYPARVLARNAKRRARQSSAPINDFTADQWKVMQEAYNHRCAYCQKRCKGKLTQDHLTPLSKGGDHTLSNIVPACRSCNCRKGNRGILNPVQPLLIA